MALSERSKQFLSAELLNKAIAMASAKGKEDFRALALKAGPKILLDGVLAVCPPVPEEQEMCEDIKANRKEAEDRIAGILGMM